MVKVNELGLFIQTKRKAAGINLRSLAIVLNINPSYMSDVEKSRVEPPAGEVLMQLAEVLNLTDIEKEKLFDLAASERKSN